MVEENNGLPKEGSDGLGVSRVLARGSASRGHGKGRARAFVLALILHFSSLYSMNLRSMRISAAASFNCVSFLLAAMLLRVYKVSISRAQNTDSVVAVLVSRCLP